MFQKDFEIDQTRKCGDHLSEFRSQLDDPADNKDAQVLESGQRGCRELRETTEDGERMDVFDGAV